MTSTRQVVNRSFYHRKEHSCQVLYHVANSSDLKDSYYSLLRYYTTLKVLIFLDQMNLREE